MSGAAEFITQIAIQAAGNAIADELNKPHGQIVAFKDKSRPIIIQVNNTRDNSFRLTGFHFESGKAFAHPSIGTHIEPGESHVFYFSNVDDGFMTGVSGWIEYVPNQFEGMISIGFSHPWSGAVKAFTQWAWGRESYDRMENTAHQGVARGDISGVPYIIIDFAQAPKY